MKYTRLCDNCKRTFEVETKCDGNDCPHCNCNGEASYQNEIKNAIEVEIEE